MIPASPSFSDVTSQQTKTHTDETLREGQTQDRSGNRPIHLAEEWSVTIHVIRFRFFVVDGESLLQTQRNEVH